MTAQLKCISCFRELCNSGIIFKCPKCKKNIARCDYCKKLGTKYKCECGFEGP